MEPKERNLHDNGFKTFMRKNLCFYFIPNMVFNWCVPYFSFHKFGTVYLFNGEHSLAKLILPMAIFLPFFVTLDILKKTITLSEQGKSGFTLPENFSKKKFMLKVASVNAGITLVIILCTLLCLRFVLPENYSFNRIILASSTSIVAGILAVIFTFQPINEIKKIRSEIERA